MNQEEVKGLGSPDSHPPNDPEANGNKNHAQEPLQSQPDVRDVTVAPNGEEIKANTQLFIALISPNHDTIDDTINGPAQVAEPPQETDRLSGNGDPQAQAAKEKLGRLQKRYLKGVFQTGNHVFYIRLHPHTWKEEGAYYKAHWIDHILETLAGKDIYLTEVLDVYWKHIHAWDIGDNYFRLSQGDGRSIILTDRVTLERASLAALIPDFGNSHREILERFIPDKAEHRAVSSSRSWKLPPKPKAKEPSILISRTSLPQTKMNAIAKEMGLKPLNKNSWSIPEGQNPEAIISQLREKIKLKQIEMAEELAKAKNPIAAAEAMYKPDMIDELKNAAVTSLMDELAGLIQELQKGGSTPALEKRIAEISEELKELR